MTRVALYARYSSTQQNARSIADQLAVLLRHAADRGWTVVGTYTDAAISGSAMANRPGLLNALADAERGVFDLLLAEDEDRIARNLEHLAHVANRLADMGAAIATLSTDRVQDMHVAFKGLIAQDYIRNLSQKTKRGMASNAEKGLATGSRLYGYRSSPGGAVEIVPEQAEVVRRIFRHYADDGMTSRLIADALNRDGVPSATGRAWSASTIQGSRQRANGILHTELYTGVKVYGRVEMRKDRATGRRVTICKPADQHRRVQVPHLRIVDQALWDRVQARKRANTKGDAATRRKPARRPFLLSGLTFCGACGAGYTAQGKNRLACAGYREKGPSFCTNRRHVNRAEVEARVLTGLRERLLSPDAVTAYVAAYHEAWAEMAEQERNRRRPRERRLGEVERAIRRAVDAVIDGAGDVSALTMRLRELEAEKRDIEATLAAEARAAPLPVQMHPRAGDRYRQRVEQLQALIDVKAAPGDLDRQLVEEVRDLIDRIEIEPESRETRAPYRVTLHGDLARLLDAPPAYVGGRMVAGGGLEPPTCGL